MGFHTAAGGREECQLKDLTPLWPVLCVFDEQVARSTSTLSTAFSHLISQDSLTLSVCVWVRETGKGKRRAFVGWMGHSLQTAACAESIIMALYSLMWIIFLLLF